MQAVVPAIWLASPLLSVSASKKSSLAMNWSPRLMASFSVASRHAAQLGAALSPGRALHLRQALDGGFGRAGQVQARWRPHAVAAL